ncbi:replication initiation and membrane attachment family protein [Alteribacillus iranensis]|uniref:Replicative DNA helicase loader DnaB n=1 Tax=Alteribacillus iranensis TaxID=930128 RepID=A0A1I2CLV1_9BACI|nr:DnaD domain protein [Alteribacillus iranensis]SFE68773.1 replicative DNA helicase loader DnaB [Alteribacillus iranensis]
MKLHWTELLPVDRFSVRTNEQLGEREHKTLTLLYQPLIGTAAISLYHTFWSRLERDSYWSDEGTHHELMVLLNLPLDDIFDARRILEGIGLLRTFRHTGDTSASFVYELQKPLSPAQFFRDDVLSVYLYNRLGKDRYRDLRSRFLIDKIDLQSFDEITASFNEVFSSLHYSEMMANDEMEKTTDLEKDLVGQGQSHAFVIDEDSFDFSLLRADLPVFINKEKLLNKKACTVIQRLAFVYNIAPLDMSRLIQQSLTGDDQLDEEELRKRVQEWYRFEHSNEPPALGLRTPSKENKELNEPPVNEKEKMKWFYEQTSPLTFLKSISDGAQVPHPDVRLVEMLVFDYQLPPGVVNVLIDFIMQTNNMKLNKNLVQKIAGHWSRKKVHTVEDAMELAKKEYQEQKDRKQAGANWKTSPSSKTVSPYVRKDKLPKWLQSENKGKETSALEKHSDLQEEKLEFEEMLKMRKSIRQK